jgi:hypothetical protein
MLKGREAKTSGGQSGKPGKRGREKRKDTL